MSTDCSLVERDCRSGIFVSLRLVAKKEMIDGESHYCRGVRFGAEWKPLDAEFVSEFTIDLTERS